MTKKSLVNLFSVVALLVMFLVIGVWVVSYYVGHRPVLQAETWVYIHPDETPASLRQQFEARQADPTGLFWTEQALGFMGVERRLASGSLTGAYRLEEGLAPLDVARRLVRREQTPVTMTFHEARFPEQIAGRLTRHLLTDSLTLLRALYDPRQMASMGFDSATVISLFLPDTYQVYWNIPAERILQRMQSEYDKFWNESRRQQAAALGLTPVEVAIIASIAEEETQDRVERGIVARLYWNRLQAGMPLQADPTVKFAVGDFTLRRILNEHLAVESPYNTYRHRGLPPGPIRCPEKATMDALLHSQPHPYLYMCAKEDFSGLHNFARTLSEHNANAARYHRAVSNLLRSDK